MTCTCLSFYRKPSFGFGIFYTLLTFCWCGLTFLIFFNLLLRILINILSKFKSNLCQILFKLNHYLSYKRNSINTGLSYTKKNTSYKTGSSVLSFRKDNKRRISIGVTYKLEHKRFISEQHFNCKNIKGENVDKHFHDIPWYLKPTVISDFNKDNVQLYPTSIEQANTVLTDVSNYTSKLKRKGSANIDDWIKINSSYKETIKGRYLVLKKFDNQVIASIPQSDKALREVFLYIMYYILKKYPYVFKLVNINNRIHIYNCITDRKYNISSIENLTKLNISRILTLNLAEDFNILELGSEDKWYLTATISCCAIGWYPCERIGWDLVSLHRQAPKWEFGKGAYAKSYATALHVHVKHDKLMHRDTIFFANSNDFFLPLNVFNEIDTKNIVGTTIGCRPQDVYLRREHQMFFRLPKTNAILFTVHTYVQDITTLDITDLLALRKHALYLKDEIKIYFNKFYNYKEEALSRKDLQEFKNLKEMDFNYQDWLDIQLLINECDTKYEDILSQIAILENNIEYFKTFVDYHQVNRWLPILNYYIAKNVM